MAESCSQLDSDPAPPTTPTRNGKRGADEPQVVGNKKHKTEEIIHCSSQEQNKTELSPSPKLPATTQDAKKASNSNGSAREDEDDDTSKENAKHLETPKKSVEEAIKSAETTLDDAERASISNQYEEEDKDVSSKEDYQHLETPNTSALNNNNELATAEHHPTQDAGSKTLYLGNLSFSIEEDDVRDFFKNVGEIADIRFAIKDDRFLGYGHIEFTTVEAAQEALKLHKEVLLDRRVLLDFSRRRQRGAYTPGSSMDKSNQRGGHAQMKTVYVRGFECSDGFDNIRSALEKHFGKCGEISRLDIPKDHASGDPKGVAFIDFADSNGFRQALVLHGSEVGGRRLIVEEARKQRGDGREGFGYGGWSGSASGWSSSSGRSSSSIGQSGSGGGWSSSSSGRGVSVGGWSSSSSGQSGSGGGWVGYGRESYSGGGLRRESGSSGSGRGWASYGRESGWHAQRGYGSISNTESGYGGWGRGRGSNDGRFSSSRVRSGSSFGGYGYSHDSRRPRGP